MATKKKPRKKMVTVPPFVQIAISGAHDEGYSAVVYGLDKHGRIWWLEDDGDSDGWELLPLHIYNGP